MKRIKNWNWTSSLGIIKVSGSSKYINKSRDMAFEALKKNFGIE